MTVALGERGGRAILSAVIVVALAAAGWLLYRHVHESGLVEGQVTGAALVWRPGSNSGTAEIHSSADETAARRLAKLLNDTPKMPRGPINCPADFGSQVSVSFREEGHHDQRVTIALTGCAGPPSRLMTGALRDDLEHLAPPDFWPQRLH